VIRPSAHAMSAIRAALARVGELFRSRSVIDTAQGEEFRFHIEMETAENLRRGMSEPEAHRAALLRFGGLQRFREETSDARGIVSIDNIARDTRFAFRRLHRAPVFAAGVIATLGIGVGAAIGIGSIVYGVLLRDLPYENPDRLVRVGFHTDGTTAGGDLHSAATYFHFAKSARSFTELGAFVANDGFILTDGDAPERANVASVTPSVFTLLGARPLIGQLFEPGDTSWSSGRTPILISENLWRRRYGADPAIIGRTIQINRGERTVIGVLPRSFDVPTPTIDLYYPTPIPVRRPDITFRGFTVIGRLRDGVSEPQAAAELKALLPSISSRFPAITPAMLQQSGARVSVTSLKSATVAGVRAQVVLLGVLVAVVLLIATTNVVNLFLLRTDRASQEIAIALSLGASRRTLAQRFVIEGAVLGLASAAIALPAAAFALSTKFGFSEREIPRLHEVSFTVTTGVLVIASAVLIGAAVGLVGLTRAGMDRLFDRLRSARSTSSRRWRRVQDGLVAFQVAIALTLLVAAGLLGRSFWNLQNAAIGFEPANAMAFQVSLPWDSYRVYGEHAAFHARAMDRLSALPGVSGVAAALRVPLRSTGAPPLDMQLRAADGDARSAVASVGNLASAEYFAVMGIPMRAGRSFQSGDLRGMPAVIVSEDLARSIFGKTDVVGRRIQRLREGDAPADFNIVGVVGDVHWGRIEDGHVPMVYFPLLRDADGLPAESRPVPYQPRDVEYVVRAVPVPAAATIQGVVKALDRRVPPTNMRTLGSLVDDATARVRLTLLLMAVAGGASLLLGVIGVYSVVSYAAAGRTREFGIRLALGAAPTRLGRMVFSDGLRLVIIGTAAGLLAAFSGMRLLRALLYEVTATSLVEFTVATAVLVAATMIATVLPARRAARTDPASVLRGE
jgi:putative ABC transport system permease protein